MKRHRFDDDELNVGTSDAKRRKIIDAAPAVDLVKGREPEQQYITAFIQGCIDRQQGDSAYIGGSPGLGKTYTVDRILCGVVGVKKIVTVGYSLPTTTVALWKSLANSISGDTTTTVKTGADLFVHQLERSGTMVLLVIDEVSEICRGKRSSVVIDLYNMAKAPNSKLILIGIANDLKFPDAIMAKMTHYTIPRQLILAPYNAEQLESIGRGWVTTENQRRQALGLKCIDTLPSGALSVLARLVVAHRSGDVRWLLSVLGQLGSKANISSLHTAGDVLKWATPLLNPNATPPHQELNSTQQAIMVATWKHIQATGAASKKGVDMKELPSICGRFIRSLGWDDKDVATIRSIISDMVTYRAMRENVQKNGVVFIQVMDTNERMEQLAGMSLYRPLVYKT